MGHWSEKVEMEDMWRWRTAKKNPLRNEPGRRRDVHVTARTKEREDDE